MHGRIPYGIPAKITWENSELNSCRISIKNISENVKLSSRRNSCRIYMNSRRYSWRNSGEIQKLPEKFRKESWKKVPKESLKELPKVAWKEFLKRSEKKLLWMNLYGIFGGISERTSLEECRKELLEESRKKNPGEIPRVIL